MVDALLAVLVTVLALASLFTRASEVLLTGDDRITFHSPDLLGVLLPVAGGLCLVARRRAPVVVLAISALTLFVYQARGYPPAPMPYAQLVALYTVASHRPAEVSAPVAGASVLGLVVAALTGARVVSDDHFLAHVLTTIAAWAVGYGVRLARTQTMLLEQRAVQLAREQSARTQLAVEQERVRIARELHDIVAHNVSVIVAQASAAQRVVGADPEVGRDALACIATVGREALTEMRRLLGILHGENDGNGSGRAPQPRLDQLPTLVAQVERTGLPVDLNVDGDARALPPGVELTAYRIVQEALTNALKHADASRATVALHYEPDALELRISDDGRGAAPDAGGGNGVVGMRQRAVLLGGELLTTTRPGGGFVVTARLPVDSAQ